MGAKELRIRFDKIDVIILIKSVVNKNEYSYNYNIIPEKDSYKDKSNKKYFQMNVWIL